MGIAQVMGRAIVFLLLGLCLSEKVLGLASGVASHSVGLNAAVAKVNSEILIISQELDAEDKAENDQLAAVQKEVLDIIQKKAGLDRAVHSATSSKDRAADQLKRMHQDKLKCDVEQAKRKAVRREEFASITTIRGLIAQVREVNSSIALEMVGNVTAAELNPVANEEVLEMVQLPGQPSRPLASNTVLVAIRELGQRALNSVAQRHGTKAVHLGVPVTADIQVDASRPHSQLDALTTNLEGIESQLNAEDVALTAECKKLDPAIAKAASWLQTKTAELRVAQFAATEAKATQAAKEKVSEALTARNVITQTNRASEKASLQRILATTAKLGIAPDTAAASAIDSKGKSAMDLVSYLLDNMVTSIDSQLQQLKPAVHAATAKLNVAAADLATKEKAAQDLQASAIAKQAVYDAKKAAYGNSETAQTEKLKQMATVTSNVERLQVMATDLLWSTSAIARPQLLSLTDPMLMELSSLEQQRSALKADVEAAEAAMNDASKLLKADEQKLAEAQQTVKEAQAEIALFDKEKRTLAKQLADQLALADKQKKIIAEVKSLVTNYLASA